MSQKEKKSKTETNPKPKKPSPLIQLFKPYTGLFVVSLVVILLSNVFNLLLPKLVGNYIDIFQKNSADLTNSSYLWLGVLVFGIFIMATVQIVLTTYLSEKIANDLRNKLINKISGSSFSFVNKTGPSELITTFSSDINNVKSIASQGLVYFLTAIILLIGSSIMMLITNWYLALIAMSILPIVIAVFAFIFSRISPLFRKSQLNLSKINQVVNESIFGSSLVRVLNSQKWEEGP